VATPDLGLNRSQVDEVLATLKVNPLGQSSFPFFLGQVLPPQTKIISRSFSIARTIFESSAASSYQSLQMEFRKRYSRSFQFGSAFTYS